MPRFASVSSRGAPASAPTSSARGSAATRCSTPTRTAGGYRLYSADDEARVRSMQSPPRAGAVGRRGSATGPRGAGGRGSERRSGGSRRSAVVCARQLRRRGRAGRLRPARGGVQHRGGRRDGHPALPADARRALARRRRLGRPGALRHRPAARAAARPGPRLGPRRRAPRAARLPVRRTPRPRAHHPRPRAARSRLARDVPRSRHADRDARSRSRSARARRRRALLARARPARRGRSRDRADGRPRGPSCSPVPARTPNWPSVSRARLLAGNPLEAAAEVSA